MKMIPSWIFCCEFHSVAAVDTMIERVVRTLRLMISVDIIVDEEENEIERAGRLKSCCSSGEPNRPEAMVSSVFASITGVRN